MSHPEKSDARTMPVARDLVRKHFGTFVNMRDKRYKFTALHRNIASVMNDVILRKKTRVILNMPPRHGKSELTSVNLPAYALGIDPMQHVVAVSYGQSLATKFGRRVRNICQSGVFKDLFPESRISPDSSGNKVFDLTAGGSYRAVGIDGTLTGLPANIAIIDDPHKNRKDAESQLKRDAVWDWYSSTLYTRLEPDAAVVVVATRWHKDDLVGRLLKEHAHENWEVISFPALDVNDKPLWPEKYSFEDLMRIKASLNPYDWAAIYQQRPTDPAGAIIKRDWVKTYTILPEVRYYVWSWDTAIKANQRNDYSVGLLWAVCENGYYLVRMFRRRVEYPELKKAVGQEYDLNRSREIIIEDKASGQQLLQEFRAHTNWPVIAMMPGKDMPLDKDSRLHLVSPIFEAGKVFVPAGQPWVNDVVDEWCSFPQGEHDDIVDATTQFLARVQHAVSPRVRLA